MAIFRVFSSVENEIQIRFHRAESEVCFQIFEMQPQILRLRRAQQCAYYAQDDKRAAGRRHLQCLAYISITSLRRSARLDSRV
jgi:hypothetical protein